jgi:hypothetical protein
VSWIVGKQNISIPNDTNYELLKLEGELTEQEARITLAKFFRYNLGFACQILLGVKLEKFQEITLYGMFNRNFTMLVWSRGASKTWLTAAYCILKCIFEPQSKILLASSTFRTSRRIFNEIEKILNNPSAILARQCFKGTLKRSDEWIYYVAEGGGTITAIPLGGERVRGQRASVLCLDEFLTLQEETVKTILMPFLNVPIDVGQRIEIRDRETDLIKEGLLTEEQRIKFPNTSQMIALSSASYTFEYLYQTYKFWCDIIDNPNILDDEKILQDDSSKVLKDSSYFVSQLSYEAIPQHMVDQAAVQAAKSQDGTNSFMREYGAQFIDGGDGYFSPKRMMEVTIPDNAYPTTKVMKDNDNVHILGIDSNFSNAKNADYFAMCLLELDKDASGRDIAYCVHNYQRAGGNVSDHIKYLCYLIKYFNIKMICLDSAGADQALGAVEASEIYKQLFPQKLGLFEFDSDKEGDDWITMLDQAKREYNPDTNNIVMKQYFTSKWILRANEYLQASIQHKRLWFASRAAAHDDCFARIVSSNLPLDLIYPRGYDEKADDPEDPDATLKMSVRDHIEWQDYLIGDVKGQCALIMPQSGGPAGIPRFDLPANLRRLSSNTRPRKDNYSALLIANWAAKIYQDLKDPNKTRLNRYQDYESPVAIVTTQL